MITLWLISSLVLAATAENLRLLDLPPEQAQQIIDSKDQSLKYAPKIESNVPGLRYIGNQRQHVIEDIYLANQYHGQDGIGGYLYGYSVPDIAKTEKKKAGGDLRGAYKYVNGGGQEIKVEYWDNGSGFHQVDNVPKILPKQIDDAPEVKAAKDAHLRRWQEEAERNSKPVPYPYNGAQYKDQYQQPNINNVDYSGQYSENNQNYQPNPTPPPREWEYQPTEEEKGPPRGFFYNFDYPVGIIVNKQGNSDLEQIYSQNKAKFDSQLKYGQGTTGTSTGYQVNY
ncbi:Insect cuticle protein [Oryctes borbonicus]|uniref:Insect cuticle protein n=1 Tax=Oryctes borbonicus TaxID=1629725 RepID=A0A0T6BFH2_9SCAR|nr:Insect cuticle protein [Oryctes borbonicus]